MILLPITQYWPKSLNSSPGSGLKAGAYSFSFLVNNQFGLVALVLILSLLAILASYQPALASSPPPYLQILLKKATELKLEDRRYWHLLLHYRSNLIGGWTSEVDDPNFFLAPDGKTNPRAELEATIEWVFSENLRGKSQQISQCAFIARFHWLKTELEMDTHQLPKLACEKFETWLTELNPQGISLIFPSAYMNNPASMFGHSFLRIDQKGQTEQTRILAYTINYAAGHLVQGWNSRIKAFLVGTRGTLCRPPTI